MKKIVLLLASFVQVCAYNIANLDIKPGNSVFVFDLHGVVLDKNGESNKLFFRHPNKGTFLNRLRKCGTKIFTADTDIAIEELTIKEGDTSEYVDATLELVNAYIPNEKMLNLIESLHGKGFKVFGCSNIGPKSLEFLKNKFVRLADIFDRCFTGFQIPTQENGFLTKMNPETYKELKTKIYNKGLQPRYIFLIDDSPKKIDAAEKAVAEFKGIEFKSAAELEKLLKYKRII